MPNQSEVYDALGKCYDPCCRESEISVVDMGLIENVNIDDGNVKIDMVLTSGWCPFVGNLNGMILDEVGQIEGVNHVDVEVVWNPVWTMDRLSDSAREKLTIPLEPLLPYREERIKREQQKQAIELIETPV
ncbi:MAG: metal-sulfur cluster assembly factor [Chloroflexota bacterium]